MRFTIIPSRQVVVGLDGETLLDACLRAGQPVSYSCLDGRCGLCRCYVAELGINREQVLGEGPLPAMRECLACQTQLRSDSVVEVPDRAEPVVLPARIAKGRVRSVDMLAADAVRLTLGLDRPFQYLGGQHFEVIFGSKERRYYSVTAGSDPDQIVFDIQIHPYGLVSQFISDTLKVGDAVRVRGPLGRSYLRRTDTSGLLLISCGTGLGAVTSLMRDIANAGLRNPVHVYAGFTFSEQVYDRDELSRWASRIPALQRCEVVVASGPLQKGDRRGLLTDAVQKGFGDLCAFTGYLFGSPSAVDATARQLLEKGMNPRNLHAVPFQAADTSRPPTLNEE